MVLTFLVEQIARRRDTKANRVSATAAPSRLERYIAEIPPERYGRIERPRRIGAAAA